MEINFRYSNKCQVSNFILDYLTGLVHPYPLWRRYLTFLETGFSFGNSLSFPNHPQKLPVSVNPLETPVDEFGGRFISFVDPLRNFHGQLVVHFP